MRYRGIYKAVDGRYRSAGTFSTEERALAVAEEAERHAAELAGGAAGGLDPATRATRTIAEYEPLFLRHHQVEGNTKETYADTLRLHVIPFLGGCRLAETDRTVARNYITALQEGGRSANTIRQAKVVLCRLGAYKNCADHGCVVPHINRVCATCQPTAMMGALATVSPDVPRAHRADV